MKTIFMSYTIIQSLVYDFFFGVKFLVKGRSGPVPTLYPIPSSTWVGIEAAWWERWRVTGEEVRVVLSRKGEPRAGRSSHSWFCLILPTGKKVSPGLPATQDPSPLAPPPNQILNLLVEDKTTAGMEIWQMTFKSWIGETDLQEDLKIGEAINDQIWFFLQFYWSSLSALAYVAYVLHQMDIFKL